MLGERDCFLVFVAASVSLLLRRLMGIKECIIPPSPFIPFCYLLLLLSYFIFKSTTFLSKCSNSSSRTPPYSGCFFDLHNIYQTCIFSVASLFLLLFLQRKSFCFWRWSQRFLVFFVCFFEIPKV